MIHLRYEWVVYICPECNRIALQTLLPPPGVQILEWCQCAKLQKRASESPPEASPPSRTGPTKKYR
jgi:hypothetical protein